MPAIGGPSPPSGPDQDRSLGRLCHQCHGSGGTPERSLTTRGRSPTGVLQLFAGLVAGVIRDKQGSIEHRCGFRPVASLEFGQPLENVGAFLLRHPRPRQQALGLIHQFVGAPRNLVVPLRQDRAERSTDGMVGTLGERKQRFRYLHRSSIIRGEQQAEVASVSVQRHGAKTMLPRVGEFAVDKGLEILLSGGDSPNFYGSRPATFRNSLASILASCKPQSGQTDSSRSGSKR